MKVLGYLKSHLTSVAGVQLHLPCTYAYLEQQVSSFSPPIKVAAREVDFEHSSDML